MGSIPAATSKVLLAFARERKPGEPGSMILFNQLIRNIIQSEFLYVCIGSSLKTTRIKFYETIVLMSGA